MGENPLLKIGLEHYVVILMWIPIIIQNENIWKKYLLVDKRLVFIFFSFPWISILIQIFFKVWFEIQATMKMICVESIYRFNINCWVAELGQIGFNILHFAIAMLLFYVASRVALEKLGLTKAFKKL